MSIEQTLSEYAQAKNNRDVEAALSVCTDDCTYESVGLPGRCEGKDDLRGFYSAFFAALPDYRGDFAGELLGDDVAVVWGTFGGTTAGDFMGLQVEPGRRIEVPVTFVCTFRDGLLASDTGYFDVATLCSQAGIPVGALKPSPGDEFVQKFAEFWSAPDASRVPNLVAPDVVLSFPGVEEPIHGAESYAAQIGAQLQLVPDLRLAVVSHIADGDRVMIEWRASGTLGGERMTLDGFDRFVLRDGLVVDAKVVFDASVVASLLTATG